MQAKKRHTAHTKNRDKYKTNYILPGFLKKCVLWSSQEKVEKYGQKATNVTHTFKIFRCIISFNRIFWNIVYSLTKFV